jgi:hypothetical protein
MFQEAPSSKDGSARTEIRGAKRGQGVYLRKLWGMTVALDDRWGMRRVTQYVGRPSSVRGCPRYGE